MIVHVGPDEKFIDMAYRDFDAVAPGRNMFVIPDRPRPLKHLKTTPARFLTNRGLIDLIRSDECEAICMHTISYSVGFLRHLPKDKNILWIGWGYDYYDLLLSKAFSDPGGVLGPRTARLMRTQLRPPGPSANERFRSIARKLLLRDSPLDPKYLGAIRYFCPVAETEYELACRLNPWFRPRYVDWNYGILADELIPMGASKPQTGDSILIGNSATETNNHLEVFETIAKTPLLAGRRLLVPLSYGDTDTWYRDRIIEAGREMFGDLFVPLVDFMPKAEYTRLLADCGHVFMGHIRQQGFGNILMMMLMGAKIYMRPESPLYQWLVRRGASISTIPADEQGIVDPQALRPLTDAQWSANRALIESDFSTAAVLRKTRGVVDTLLGPVGDR
jgi:dTDP-N-acetylfucosamine:lipid II N-acetylfucosaminyltransferase